MRVRYHFGEGEGRKDEENEREMVSDNNKEEGFIIFSRLII